MQETIFIGGGGEGYATSQSLTLIYANRHGLIAGQQGLGKQLHYRSWQKNFPQLVCRYFYRM
jgi:MoxR-like ATPase